MLDICRWSWRRARFLWKQAGEVWTELALSVREIGGRGLKWGLVGERTDTAQAETGCQHYVASANMDLFQPARMDQQSTCIDGL